MSEQVVNNVNAEALSTLLIPIDGKQLILPNVTVAEIIPYVEAQPVGDAPDWLLGMIEWRTQLVPLVCFEKLNQQPAGEEGGDSRIAVLNGIVDSEKLPFCAIKIAGVPRGLRIRPNEMSSDDSTELGAAELSAVWVNGESASVPNVDWLQQQVIEQL